MEQSDLCPGKVVEIPKGKEFLSETTFDDHRIFEHFSLTNCRDFADLCGWFSSFYWRWLGPRDGHTYASKIPWNSLCKYISTFLISSFKSLEPPIDELRWASPEPASPWSPAILNATGAIINITLSDFFLQLGVQDAHKVVYCLRILVPLLLAKTV